MDSNGVIQSHSQQVSVLCCTQYITACLCCTQYITACLYCTQYITACLYCTQYITACPNYYYYYYCECFTTVDANQRRFNSEFCYSRCVHAYTHPHTRRYSFIYACSRLYAFFTKRHKIYLHLKGQIWGFVKDIFIVFLKG